MPFIGNQPALSYTSFAKQDFTTSATTSYTLDYPVANENEIALFINFVRQEPTTAYTASGTSLTLTSATSASDDMYAIFLGKAVQTVTPASGSVTGDMLSKPFNYDSGTLYLDDTNNRVGIGTTSPSSALDIIGGLTVDGNDNNIQHDITRQTGATNASRPVIRLTAKNTASDVTDGFGSAIQFRMKDDTADVELGAIGFIKDGADGSGAFAVGQDSQLLQSSPQFIVDSSGLMHIGDTVPAYNSSTKATTIGSGTIYTRRETTLARGHHEFYNPNGAVGSIVTTNSSTAYNTTSDYRLKENVSYDFDATTRLKQLKPARFNFIADANSTVDGFLAHEVSSVVPEAITGIKDAVQVWEEGEELPEGVSVGDNKLDENGNTIPKYQGIDQSKLVPLLVKTIQELEARITALENN